MKQSAATKPVARHSPQPLNEAVKAWRAARGLSAVQAAELLEISSRTLEGIEQGRAFRYEKILRLALNSA